MEGEPTTAADWGDVFTTRKVGERGLTVVLLVWLLLPTHCRSGCPRRDQAQGQELGACSNTRSNLTRPSRTHGIGIITAERARTTYIHTIEEWAGGAYVCSQIGSTHILSSQDGDARHRRFGADFGGDPWLVDRMDLDELGLID